LVKFYEQWWDGCIERGELLCCSRMNCKAVTCLQVVLIDGPTMRSCPAPRNPHCTWTAHDSRIVPKWTFRDAMRRSRRLRQRAHGLYLCGHVLRHRLYKVRRNVVSHALPHANSRSGALAALSMRATAAWVVRPARVRSCLLRPRMSVHASRLGDGLS